MNRRFHQEYRVMRINPAKKEKNSNNEKLRKKFTFFHSHLRIMAFFSNSSNSLDFIVKV